jgi:hypothetical protein
MTKVLLCCVLLFQLEATAKGGAASTPPNSAVQAPAVQAPLERRQQLEAAREELSQSLARIQKQIGELPEAAEMLKRVEAELKAQVAEIESRIAALEAGESQPLPSSNTEPPAAEPSPGAEPPSSDEAPLARPPQLLRPERRLIIDSALGVDKQTTIVTKARPDNAAAVPFKAEVKSFISSMTLTGEYPLNRNTIASVVLPYIYQRARFSSPEHSFTKVGQGIGDVTLLVERRFLEIARGTELSLAAGLQIPTGKDPSNLKENELPTGTGFYQPLLRAALRKMVLPLQFYGKAEYGTSLKRRIQGDTVRLPSSYGGEVGFLYIIGPEFIAQTALSLRRVSSPFLWKLFSTEGYLSQSLNYRTGGRDSFRGSVDVGLTEESTDFWFGLSFRREF